LFHEEKEEEVVGVVVEMEYLVSLADVGCHTLKFPNFRM
jgi:3-methyladenine DNA glycosylase Mpg